MSRRIRKAVFPVAGLGTRFLPATKSMPKEMLPVVDKPLIQYALEEAQAAGIEEFIFVTGRGKTAIEDHFDRSFELEQQLEAKGRPEYLELIRKWMPPAGQIAYTRQREPLGLGHAVWCARNFIDNEPFAVLLADDLILAEKPVLKQMVEAFNETGGNIVAVMDVPRAHTNRYGILDVAHDDGRLIAAKGMIEKPSPDKAPSTASVVGRYILMPRVFDHLSAQQPGAGGEIQLTDALARMIGEMPFHGLRYAGTRYDCGDKLGFLQATIAFALARPDMGEALRQHLRSLNL